MVSRYDEKYLSVVTIVDKIIEDAIEAKASDIHLEPTETELHVRFRIDGVLQLRPSLSSQIQQQIISRFKILAAIDTAESRLPQDGKIRFDTQSGKVDLRVSTFPSIYGQKVVVRILDREYNFLKFEQLGLDKRSYAIIKSILDKPQGLFLVTGPTGSGKTTTLYALLSYLNKPERNIVTLEDPVEYDIEGITQGHVIERVGFGFAVGMRSILRQDPDVIMIGEIRDSETARTAVQAALTGHLVLSTLHTNDASSTIMRLVDMGIEPYLINAALSGVLAQRLARKLCSCKKKQAVSDEDKNLLKASGATKKILNFPVGCEKCNHLGYKSRIGLFECMPMNEKMRAVLEKTLQRDLVQKEAIRNGLRTLQQEAAHLLNDGIISLEEYMRVV